MNPGAARTPTPSPSAGGIPLAYLVSAEGRDVAGGIGSHCWDNLCADMIGPITNVDPFFLVVETGYSFRFQGEQPSHTTEQWISVSETAPRVTAAGRVWESVVPAGGSPTPSGAGDYLVLLQAFFSGGRDVSYGFYVHVP